MHQQMTIAANGVSDELIILTHRLLSFRPRGQRLAEQEPIVVNHWLGSIDETGPRFIARALGSELFVRRISGELLSTRQDFLISIPLVKY